MCKRMLTFLRQTIPSDDAETRRFGLESALRLHRTDTDVELHRTEPVAFEALFRLPCTRAYTTATSDLASRKFKRACTRARQTVKYSNIPTNRVSEMCVHTKRRACIERASTDCSHHVQFILSRYFGVLSRPPLPKFSIFSNSHNLGNTNFFLEFLFAKDAC